MEIVGGAIPHSVIKISTKSNSAKYGKIAYQEKVNFRATSVLTGYCLVNNLEKGKHYIKGKIMTEKVIESQLKINSNTQVTIIIRTILSRIDSSLCVIIP